MKDHDAATIRADQSGVTLSIVMTAKSTPELAALAEKLEETRAIARQTKDFTQVDRLKAALLAAGVEVRMSKAGVDLVPGAGFDAGKLEGVL